MYPLQQQFSGPQQQQSGIPLQTQLSGPPQQIYSHLEQQLVHQQQQQSGIPLQQQLSGPIQQIYGHLEQQLVYPQQQQSGIPLQQHQQFSGPLQKQLSGPSQQQYVGEERGQKRERTDDILRHIEQSDFDMETEPRKRSAYSSGQSSDTGIGIRLPVVDALVRYDQMNEDQLRQLVIKVELLKKAMDVDGTTSGISVPHTAHELVIDAAMDELAGDSMDDDTLLMEFGALTPRSTAPNEDTSFFQQWLEWRFDCPE
jgi:hypothetical protein